MPKLCASESFHAFEDGNVGIVKRSSYTDINADEVHPAESIVRKEHHSHISDSDVLERAHYRGGEGGVQSRAKKDGVIEDAAHECRQDKHEKERPIVPPLIVIYSRESTLWMERWRGGVCGC